MQTPLLVVANRALARSSRSEPCFDDATDQPFCPFNEGQMIGEAALE